MPMSPKEPLNGVRIDKWLWAARCYKTRAIAQEACEGGHVSLNDAAVKPAKLVKVGDRIDLVLDDWTRNLEVVGLSEVRGPAEVARTLYVDHSPPRPVRPPPIALRDRGSGRPTKRDRRELDRLMDE